MAGRGAVFTVYSPVAAAPVAVSVRVLLLLLVAGFGEKLAATPRGGPDPASLKLPERVEIAVYALSTLGYGSMGPPITIPVSFRAVIELLKASASPAMNWLSFWIAD